MKYPETPVELNIQDNNKYTTKKAKKMSNTYTTKKPGANTCAQEV